MKSVYTINGNTLKELSLHDSPFKHESHGKAPITYNIQRHMIFVRQIVVRRHKRLTINVDNFHKHEYLI